MTSNCHFTSSSIVGGDYAGFTATFSQKSGNLISVPNHLVPKAMLEWGDVPSYLETLTSENVINDGMERTTITVLPEVGCGIDNLETAKRLQAYTSDNTQYHTNGSEEGQQMVATLDRLIQKQQFDLETIFQGPHEAADGENEEIMQYSRRLRISFSVDTSTSSLTSDIRMQVERRISDQSTNGIRWTGEASNSGGLDAQTVVNHIGKDIVYGDVFGVKNKKNGDIWSFIYGGDCDFLFGTWTQTIIQGVHHAHVKKEVLRDKADFGFDDNESSGISAARLPQNILIRYGHNLSLSGESDANQWGIEVSRFQDLNGKLQRQVVLRLFSLDGPEGKHSTSHHWVEQR